MFFYVFRSLKSFHTRISNAVRLNCPEIPVYKRDSILRLTAATHIQFSAPIFKDFIRHSFVKSGYVDRMCDNYFQSPLQYCLNRHVKKSECFDNSCDSMAFIRCAWCAERMCVKHLAFNNEIHFCRDAKLQLE